MQNIRKTAFTLIKRVLCDGAYSVLVLDNAIKNGDIDVRDASFLTRLFYGVLERKLFLDDIIRQYSKIPVKKIDSDVLIILEMSFYQLLFMDKVPENAVVNEAVKLCKKMRLFSSSGFVNALLRSFIRNSRHYEESTSLSVKYSVSDDIAGILTGAYGYDMTVKILEGMFDRPPVYIRINTTKTTKQELLGIFDDEGVACDDTCILENTLKIRYKGSIEKLESFISGLYFVEDISSQICGEIIGSNEGEILCDVCAAPGGKSFYSAIRMNGKGTVYSYDKHENKIPLIESGAKRLSLENIVPSVRDALDKDSCLPNADRVLCDVPCSGIGILRRKPEIRYKKVTYIDIFPKLQYDILCISGNMSSTGCDLIYSTCSLNPKENIEVVERFLNEHKNYEPVPITLPSGLKRTVDEPLHVLTVLPFMCDCDGFFIAKMKKVKDD